MYLSEKPCPIDFYKSVDAADNGHVTTMAMAIEPTAELPRHHNHRQHRHQHQQVILPDNTSSSGDEQPPAHLRPASATAPQKKRAETWTLDETRVLISLRREVDSLFNTSKSNRHLWDQISTKMREKGFDRSATMCTDKWRNLLKEFKKVRSGHHPGSPSGKMSYFGDLEDLLRERQRVNNHKSPNNSDNNINNTAGADSKVNMFIQFSENGLGDGNIPFGSGEAGAGPPVDIERNLDHDDDPLALTTADAVAANGVPPWNWRENSGDGGERNTNCAGRVITVKWGVHVRRIGIDGTAEAIKEAIKSTFGLRTNRAFWLVDEFNVTRSFDQSMPLGDYNLHVDEGISIKLCLYDESDHMAVRDKTLYSEDHFRDFLTRNGFAGLREINGYVTFDSLSDLQPGVVYQVVRV